MPSTYRESFLDVEELRERGWTETLIARHLGAAERWLGVDHWANYTGKRAWSVERVEVTERTSRFIEDYQKSLRRRRCKPEQIKNFNAARAKTAGQVEFLKIPLRETSRPKEISKLKLLKTQKEISYKVVDLALFSCFSAVGIVNPFGPTLTCLGTLGEWKAGNVLHLLRVSINPFSTNAKVVGEVSVGNETNWHELIEQSASELKGGNATLLLTHRGLNEGQTASIFRKLVREYSDVTGILKRVEKYFANPIDRVSFEIESAVLSDDESAGSNNRVDEAEVIRLVELFMANEHRDKEIEAFLEAWEGSIRHARFLAPEANVEELVKVLYIVGRQVDLPKISGKPLF
jgi:hypothetical protein